MGQQHEDPLDGLEERLQNHAKAFESLLALTPAREYYGSQIDDGLDPSEQWNRKKQTKEQKRAAKKAKLDPANQKSALDVMKEREKKRKRELGIDDEEAAGDRTAEDEPTVKKPKHEPTAEESEAKRKEKADKRREKRELKKQKADRLKSKSDAKKAAKQDKDLAEAQAEKQAGSGDHDNNDDEEEQPSTTKQLIEMEKVDVAGLAESADENSEEDEDENADASSAPTSPAVNSPSFDLATNHSEASSSSSIMPPRAPGDTKSNRPTSNPPVSAKADLKLDLTDPRDAAQKALPSFTDIPSGTSSPKIQLPNIDQAELQERLRKRIEELRAQRKADGGDGKPAKSRQELLEQRRKKEEQRKAHKKELRRQAKEEEVRKRDEQLRGSGSPMSTDIFSQNSPRPQQENNFSFSRLAFDDGTAADASLSELRDAKKRKGPQDPKTALEAAQKKQSRLAALDAEKRADIADKDMWLNAKKRAHGERVRDDTSLLKKALKRKEKQKGKSEKEWKEREQAVVKGKEMKQKKREANLAKRREEKGQKGKKKPSGAKSKKKARPGFEGRFKA